MRKARGWQHWCWLGVRVLDGRVLLRCRRQRQELIVRTRHVRRRQQRVQRALAPEVLQAQPRATQHRRELGGQPQGLPQQWEVGGDDEEVGHLNQL